MRVLIAGGTGFLGSALRRALIAGGHETWVLTRQTPRDATQIQWDGRSVGSWAARLSDVDAVVNITGYGLEHWPWTATRKRRFVESRVLPGAALSAAIEASPHRPAVLVQISGINYYGLRGEDIADEASPPGEDFLAKLSVQWEAATRPVELVGVRRAVARSAVVLARDGGLFPLMALPVRMLIGGPLGDGRQAVPWIHLDDEVAALRFLLENDGASGAFNLIAPHGVSNEEFMRTVARSLRRPYWFPTPAFLLRLALGGMSDLVLEGRYSRPRRLEEAGFTFRYPELGLALDNLFERA